MKKVLVSVFAIIFSLAVFAQDSTNSMSKTTPHRMQNHDGVLMRNGKLMVMKSGQTSMLTQDLTLSNGTVVMANGTVKKQDGTTVILQDGDYVGMDGTMGNMKNRMHQNKMGKDSTMMNKMSTDSAR
jgi:hypothetical protein